MAAGIIRPNGWPPDPETKATVQGGQARHGGKVVCFAGAAQNYRTSGAISSPFNVDRFAALISVGGKLFAVGQFPSAEAAARLGRRA